jgi:hypothetical protein
VAATVPLAKPNYAFGCAFQGALARGRSISENDGDRKWSKTVSIDLRIVEGVGYIAEHEDVGSFMRLIGMQPISESYLHVLLGYYCSPVQVIEDPQDAQIVGVMTEGEMRRKGIVRPRFLQRPLWSALKDVEKVTVAIPSGKAKTIEATKVVVSSNSQETHTKATVAGSICQRLSDMLSLNIADIDPGKPLRAFGVDSLVAMEMRTWFREELGLDVLVFLILSNISIEGLAEKVVVDGKISLGK